MLAHSVFKVCGNPRVKLALLIADVYIPRLIFVHRVFLK